MSRYESCRDGCERNMRHAAPDECWTSGLLRPASFVRGSFEDEPTLHDRINRELLAGLRADPVLSAELAADGTMRQALVDDWTMDGTPPRLVEEQRARTDHALDGWEQNTVVLPISPLMALDFNLLEPGTEAHAAAVQQQEELTARIDAWRRSWPGRRSRARAAIRQATHAVRHRAAELLDPGCMAADD